jgi:P-type E1-E2 ATPase
MSRSFCYASALPRTKTIEVDPNQKERILLALKKMRHVVGFLGDGVNDAPAMHAADTSISVVEAVDEVAGALVAFSTVGKSAALLALAFVTFRIFDITKIFPARQAEQLPSGWGIVADDLIAGAWTAALIAAVRTALAGAEVL